MNKALSWKTDEHFTEGKRYDCGTLDGNMIEVFDENNEKILVGIDDEDFTFMFNIRTCDGCSRYGDFYKPECRDCLVIGNGSQNNYCS